MSSFCKVRVLLPYMQIKLDRTVMRMIRWMCGFTLNKEEERRIERTVGNGTSLFGDTDSFRCLCRDVVETFFH